MYVASSDDRRWLLNEQRKLYARSRQDPAYVFRKLWGLVTDPRNLRNAFARVSRNRGRRTAGVDRVTVRMVLADGVEDFVAGLRQELRAGIYRPSPARRVFIPKAGKPGKFRPLGIPTVKDRVVQAAVKNIMEPIFEAGFYPISYGFRPAKSVHGALEHFKQLTLPRSGRTGKEREKLPYQWVIEGDVKGCFDNIGHHGLMERVRRRIGDHKLTRLLAAFLKAGVLSEDQFMRSDSGTPQGGILSPLLANIALSAIEERYERFVWPRGDAGRPSHRGRPTKTLSDPEAIERRACANRCHDRQSGRAVFMPIRYADDFIILVSVPPGHGREVAEQEKAALAAALQAELGLSLSEEKTLITPVTSVVRFLGHHLRVRQHPVHGRLVSHAVIPKERSKRLRRVVKEVLSRKHQGRSLEDLLKVLNPVLRGWGNFYRHAWGAKRVFGFIDHCVWWAIYRWLRKKHPRTPTRELYRRFGWRKPRGRMIRWREGKTLPVCISELRVRPFRLAWQSTPDFASTSMESPVRNERRTPGSVRGARKPRGATRG
jgi:group II intron reverse transcriptase/maturase